MAPRGRKPDANHLKVVRGSRRADHAGGAPAADENIGDAPESWTPRQKAIWYEVVNAAPPGVLTKSDRVLVELTCRLLGEVRGGNLTAAMATQLRTALNELGMTPGARERLAKPTGEGKNEFENL